MNKIQKKIVIDALEYEYILNDWESEFVNDLAEKARWMKTELRLAEARG